jgi:hypothetical protein
MQPPKQERSLMELFTDLTQSTADLVRQEVALAKAEASEKVSQIGSAVASLAVGGLLAFAGLLILLQALVVGLAEFMPGWLASLIVGGVAALIGLGLLLAGRSALRAQSLAPRRTAESLRRDRDMVREQMG